MNKSTKPFAMASQRSSLLGLAIILLLASAFLGASTRDCYLTENGAIAASTKVPNIEGKKGAVVGSGSDRKELPATNFYYDGNNVRPRFGKLIGEIFSRSPEQLESLNRTMTSKLGDLGMDFVVKDERGLYTKRHQVPVHAAALPVDAKYYQELHKTTEPFLKACRAFLQAYFASGENPGLREVMSQGRLPAEAAPQVQELLNIVNQSIYRLPGLHGPQMRDYPVLAGPVGFDAVLKNLDKAEGIFFEPNLGTPSGITNLTKELELLAEVDPQQFGILSEAMVENNTFKIFRESLESAGKAWTGKDGIAVVVGPGEFNGAHPDVASISMLTGMPLVKPGELYVAKNGDVFLNTGNGKKHPRVNAIYSRMEESFILQEGSSLNQGASPLIQTFVDNLALSRKIGVPLKSGVWYDYIYQDQDITKDVIGVNMDANGNPKMMTAFDQILGSSPDGAPASSLRQAVMGKKVYLNNVGGRIIDDKSAFKLLHEIGNYFRGNSQLPVAGPPPTLPKSEWRTKFLGNVQSDQWVVKVVDSSGGDGVYIFANMTPVQRDSVARQVVDVLNGASASNFEIQYFTTSAAQVTTKRNRDGSVGLTNRVVDGRLFSMFYADGHVDAGPTSALLRTAPEYSAKANTSAGGGYGILVPLADRPLNLPREKILPGPPQQQFMGQRSESDLRAFGTELKQIMSVLSSGEAAVRQINLKGFAISVKRVMNLVGWKYQVLRVRAEQFAQREITYERFVADMGKAYAELRKEVGGQSDTFPARGVKATLRASL